MPILYDWPVDYPVWSGNVDEAEVYFSRASLDKGKYLFVTDYSRLDDITFFLVKTAASVKLVLGDWMGKGIDRWEWRGRYLYVYMTEASPIAPALIAMIALAIISVVGLAIAWKIAAEVRAVFTELGVSGKIFLAGVGISLIGGVIVNIMGPRR